MTAHLFSPSGLLLVNPMRPQWFTARGAVIDEPTAPLTGVRVVADLVEETHVVIEVPGLMGRDRTSYIDVQCQSLLPDVSLRSIWERPFSQPLLPRPFLLHAVGVSSPALNEQLIGLIEASRPIEGVWTLSYLMARWAARHGGIGEQSWVMLCLGLPYGMRMVLLHDGVPVFSRLLLEDAPAAQAREVGLTLKYLSDNRIIERDVRAAILPMAPAPDLLEALQELGLNLLPPAMSRHAQGMLAEVLSLAGPQAAGQLAGVEVRRHHLAQRARRGLLALTVAVALAGVIGLVMQARALMGVSDQSRVWQEQASEMVRSANAIRSDLAQREINVPLLRLAMAVQQKELQGGVDPGRQLWMMGQLMSSHPQAQLLRTEAALSGQACAAAQATAGAVPPVADAEGVPAVIEWQFEISPSAELLPRQRQALLESLSRSVAAWSDWQIKVDPVRVESATALAGGQGASVSQTNGGWRWCLVPRTPALTQEGAP